MYVFRNVLVFEMGLFWKDKSHDFFSWYEKLGIWRISETSPVFLANPKNMSGFVGKPNGFARMWSVCENKAGYVMCWWVFFSYMQNPTVSCIQETPPSHLFSCISKMFLHFICWIFFFWLEDEQNEGSHGQFLGLFGLICRGYFG